MILLTDYLIRLQRWIFIFLLSRSENVHLQPSNPVGVIPAVSGFAPSAKLECEPVSPNYKWFGSRPWSFSCQRSFWIFVSNLKNRFHLKEDEFAIPTPVSWKRISSFGLWEFTSYVWYIYFATNFLYLRGIPYAQPPVGNLRFAPPEPYHGNQTIINATTYVCPY